MNFGMTISEGKATGATVARTGHIGIGGPGHVHLEITVIDRARVFIDEDESLDRGEIPAEVGFFGELAKTGVKIRRHEPGRWVAGAAHLAVHGIAANTRSINSGSSISAAFIDFDPIVDKRGEQGCSQEDEIGVGV